MAVWSPESIVKFINLYKKHPCLWKVKCPDYKNRQKRARAYGELVAFCKRIGFKNANREFASKKIQCLRGAFRKELRKILISLEQTKSEEYAYKPSLFYFDLLMFTKDQEMEDDDEANDDDNDNNQDDEVDDENDDSNDGSWKDVKDIAKIDVSPHPETSANTSNTFSIDGRFCQRDEVSVIKYLYLSFGRTRAVAICSSSVGRFKPMLTRRAGCSEQIATVAATARV